ncbi:hypothetical protein [Cryobacterium sp. LW097]|uniref:hypothetical protein n=1 Tax=Cryobacterium sp. LW097 TaxID=1978566 RepID=UPI0012444D40|nr:hypothetical protein [Cryobacterium sp. LW097]
MGTTGDIAQEILVAANDDIPSVLATILVAFGVELEAVDGFEGKGSDLAILLGREKAPNEIEIRTLLEANEAC